MKQINEDEFIKFLQERHRDFKDLIILMELGHSEIFTDELLNEFEEWQKGATER